MFLFDNLIDLYGGISLGELSDRFLWGNFSDQFLEVGLNQNRFLVPALGGFKSILLLRVRLRFIIVCLYILFFFCFDF